MMSKQTPDFMAPVEAELSSALQPVRPSKGFVQTVRNQIHFSPTVLVANKPPQSQRYLLVLGGVLSAGLLILTGARAIFYFVHRARA